MRRIVHQDGDSQLDTSSAMALEEELNKLMQLLMVMGMS
jgi:hypothetical protein